MKIFAFQENLDNQQKKILSRIRQLMNGEVSEQLQAAGMNYKKAFGVSLVHLRQLARISTLTISWPKGFGFVMFVKP